MDYLERINRAVYYIENHLKESIRLEEVAHEACFSKYHFIRIFQAMTGETVGSYVRKRRLTKASQELIESKKRIHDIAFDYQFENQESFTRSFKNMYHQTPRDYRKKGTNQIAFSRARLTARRLQHLEKGIQNQPKIMEVNDIPVVGLTGTTNMINNQLYELWNVFLNRIAEIKNKANPLVYFEVHPFEFENAFTEYTEETELTKIASIEVYKCDNIPNGMVSLKINGGKYAVFTHHGSISKIQMSYDYIWGTWLPNSGFEVDERNDFERYDDKRFKGINHPDTEVDIYLPLK